MTLLTLDAALTLILAMLGGAFALRNKYFWQLTGSVCLGAMGLVLAYFSSQFPSMAQLAEGDPVSWAVLNLYFIFYAASLTASLLVCREKRRPSPRQWLGQLLKVTLVTLAVTLMRNAQLFSSAEEAAYFLGVLFTTPLALGFFLFDTALVAHAALCCCRRKELHRWFLERMEDHPSDQD